MSEELKEGAIVVRRDGQVGIVDGKPSKTTGRVWVKFDMEKPSHYVEISRLTLYKENAS